MTVVELLTVASVVAMLVAILLPAMAAVRDGSRRTACGNSARSLAKAFSAHDASLGQIPGWRNALEPYTTAQAGMPGGVGVGRHGACVSWAVPILAYVGEKEIADWYATFRTDRTATDDARLKRVAVFVCPSAIVDSPAPLSYCVNGGNGGAVLSGSAPAARRQYPADGVCGDAAGNLPSQAWYVQAGEAAAYAPVRMSLGAVAEGDGTSTTLLLAERTGIAAPRDVSWADHSLPAVSNPFDDARKSNHAVLQNVASPSGATPSSQATAVWMTKRNDAAVRFPSSQHGTGFVAAFCDQHVAFVSETIDEWVYAQLLSSSSVPGKLSEQVRRLQRKPGPDGSVTDYVFDESDIRPRGR
jgi:hypothetical protein